MDSLSSTIPRFHEGHSHMHSLCTRLCCRHEARDIVRHAVGASEQDAVLFTGQGTAAALRTLLRHLDLSKSTVVFVGPFEHHANLRPWRELDVKVSVRPGRVDKFAAEKPGAAVIRVPDKQGQAAVKRATAKWIVKAKGGREEMRERFERYATNNAAQLAGVLAACQVSPHASGHSTF